MKLKFLIALFSIIVINATGQDTSKVVFQLNDNFQIKSDSIRSDSWFSQDKGQHFIGSLISTVLTSQISYRYFDMNKSKSKIIGSSISLSIGLTKELLDDQKVNNYFSWKDLIANAAGIAIGIVLLEIK